MAGKQNAKKKSRRKNGGTGEPIYRLEFIEQARVACIEFGATDVQLGRLFKVTKKTIATWKREKPEFGKAVQEAKDEFDSQVVERSLLKRATGYDYWEITKEAIQTKDPGSVYPITVLDKNGRPKLMVTKRVKKHLAPETAAGSIWLFNRQPDRWKNPRHQVEHTGPEGGSITLKVINDYAERGNTSA